MVEYNPDWGIGAPEPTAEQIEHWEAIKYIVSPIGNNMYLSGFPDDKYQQKTMANCGIRTVISCTHKEPAGIPGVTIIRVPFDDDSKALPDPKMVADTVETINALLDRKEPVLIHCMYGLNRSAYLAAHVIAKRVPDATGEEILEHLRFARPGALHNQLFANAVLGLNTRP